MNRAGNFAILILVVINSALWLLFPPLDDQRHNFEIQYLGEIFSTSALLLMSVNVLLSLRVNRTKNMSNETAQAIDKEIRRVVEQGYERAKSVLTEFRSELETLAQALLEYETLIGDEIKAVLAGTAIDRGSTKGPTIPAAGSSIPKAKRPKPGIGGAAPAGA